MAPSLCKMTQVTKNQCLFGTTRTEKREKLFKWFGSILKPVFGLLGKKSGSFQVKNIKDLLKYKIGSINKYAPEQMIIEAGFPEEKLYRVTYPDNL